MKKGLSMAMSLGALMAVIVMLVAMYYVYTQVKQAENFQDGKCFGAKDVKKCCDDWANSKKITVPTCQGGWEVINSTAICSWKCGS
jgi:hypothetical protein